MIISTTETLNNKQYEILGIVQGSTVQSKNIGKDILSSFKSMVGGEIEEYTKMMNEARAIAYDRMIADAERMGADAIVSFRFTSSAIMQNASEILAYGTAVKIL